MQLNEIIAAITASADGALPDFTDETVYTPEALSGLLAEAVTAGTALGADQIPAKRAHVQFAKAARAEIDRRAAAAQAAIEADAENTDLDAALAAVTPEPVTASDDPTETPPAPAEPEPEPTPEPAEDAAPAAEPEPAPAEPVLEPVAASTDPATTSPTTPTTEGSMTTSTSPDLNAQVAELTAAVATMQAERLAEADTARRAALTLDAPNQAAATETATPRRATLTILRDGQEPVQSNDVLTFGERVRQVAENSATFNENKIIASVPVFEPGTPMLQSQNAGGNTELLFTGTQSRREARTAAACDCGPLARRLDLPVCWTTDTPFADSITNRWPIETMSYEFFRSTPLSEITDGVEVWTCDQQAAIDPANVSTWKPCATLDCETEKVTANAWAVWSCLLIDEFQNWSILPIAENRIAALAAQTARTTEAQLLARLRQLSRHYSAVAPLGAYPGLFEIFDAATVGIEWADRLSDVMWTPIVPMGLAQIFATDDRNKAFGEPDLRSFSSKFTDAGYAAPVIIRDDYLGAVTPQWIPNGGTIGGPTIPLPTFKAQTPAFRVYLVDMNSIHMGQRNVYTMREVRDLDRYRQNQYGLVAETAMSLDRHGCVAPIALHVALCPSGTRSELTTYDCDAADYGLGS